MKSKMKLLGLFVVLLIMNMFFVLAANPAGVQGNNVRIVEDTLWLIVFVMVIITAFTMAKFTAGGMKGISTAYWVLLVSGVSGVMWKGIGLVKRVFELKEPDWFFNIARESFEGATGLIFGIAFLMMVYAITRKQ